MLTITRFTREIAFNSMSHKYIIPTMSIIIIAITPVTIKDVNKSKESKMNVHMNIAISVSSSCAVASCHILTYCS